MILVNPDRGQKRLGTTALELTCEAKMIVSILSKTKSQLSVIQESKVPKQGSDYKSRGSVWRRVLHQKTTQESHMKKK
jgi:hypothetical protein